MRWGKDADREWNEKRYWTFWFAWYPVKLQDTTETAWMEWVWTRWLTDSDGVYYWVYSGSG